MNFALILIGGGIGSLFRYLFSGFIHRHFTGTFPWGTLGVNLIGSFLVGFLWEIFDRFTLSSHLKIFIFIGLIGGFTTFSTYTLESTHLLRDGKLVLSLLNVLISNVAGVFLVFIGLFASRNLLRFLGVGES